AWALIAYVLIVGFGNRLQYFLNAYQTAVPFKTMMGGIAIAILLGGLFYSGGLAVLFGIASYFSNRAFGEERLPVGARMPGVYYRDAVWIGVCGTAGFIGLRRAVEAASLHWPTLHRGFPASFGQNFDDVLPAAGIFGHVLISSLLLTGLIALVAGFVAGVLRARWLRYGLFLLGALSMTGSAWGNGADFAKQFLAEALILAVIVFAVRRVIRFNVLGCVLVVACLTLLGAATELLAQPDAFYRTNGYAVVLLVLMLLGWPVSVWRMRASTGS
ncbi:MAG: hypothetical protein ACRD51_15660, partial [Candidatus Acidiferrum sp.]